MIPADEHVLRSMLMADEGLRLKPYTDTVGRLSIGYGRNLTDTGINQTEAIDLLLNDIRRAVSDLQTAFPFVLELDGARQVVLAAMSFNIGIGRLSKFSKMWAALRARDFNTAATEMINSEWSQQVGARATRLASAMASGEIK